MVSSLGDIDFVDDVAVLSHTRQDLQENTNRLKEISQKVGLKFNKKKSKVMGLKHRNPVSVYIDQEELETTDTFTYPGSIVCKEGEADFDITNCMNKARGGFCCLRPVWKSTIYSGRTKLKLYQSCVLCTLL